MCLRLEGRMAAGDGVTLPDADAELARFAGMVDVAHGDWPDAFRSRAGETICVAVSPFTGNYEFFDETSEVFWTVVPAFPTTENWVAPFRHAEDGPFPDDALYAPWRLVDVWFLSTTEHTEDTEGGASSPSEPPRLDSHAEFAEFESHAENADTFAARRSALVTRGATVPVTNLCFTAFFFSETNLDFTAAWPTNETLPESTVDLYGTTNLLDPRWMFLSSHPATTNPVAFAVDPVTLPWSVEPTQHVHGATCVSTTNVVASPLDGSTVYTNVFWSCSTNRIPGAVGFFRLGTRRDTDGDGLPDAWERLVAGSDSEEEDSDFDGLADGEEVSLGADPLAADTDGDGMSDEEEVLSGCNPLVPGLPVGATIRYFRDDDDRLVGAFPGTSPAAAGVRWSPAGDPARSRERRAR